MLHINKKKNKYITTSVDAGESLLQNKASLCDESPVELETKGSFCSLIRQYAAT